jgi:PIN domain nuclease of toxin-antitoxin system
MNDALLLDTHIALWLDSGDEQLKAPTRARIDGCWKNGGTILLSAVSTWEIAVLVDRGHIQLDLPLDRWLNRFLDRPGVKSLPLEHNAAIRACQLHHLEHRDPGDRLLIASAIEIGCPFVTYDDRIVQFGRARGEQYGFTLAE